MQLNNRFRQAVLLLLLISPVSLFAAPLLSDPQTTIAQCQEIQCEPASCDNPIRLDGQCCPICVEPGIYIRESKPLQCMCVWSVHTSLIAIVTQLKFPRWWRFSIRYRKFLGGSFYYFMCTQEITFDYFLQIWPRDHRAVSTRDSMFHTAITSTHRPCCKPTRRANLLTTITRRAQRMRHLPTPTALNAAAMYVTVYNRITIAVLIHKYDAIM